MTDDRDDLAPWARRGIVPLGELAGHHMADDEPDVRGWDVLAPNAERIGRVAELLVERGTAEVAAVVVTLTMRAADGASRVVLPIERVAIAAGERALVARDAEVGDREPSNVIDAGTVTRRPGVAERGALPDDAVPTGVTVERDGDEEIVRVPIVEERLVVERRPVVTEVVTIRKRLVRDGERVIEADLRKERVDVQRTDDPTRGRP